LSSFCIVGRARVAEDRASAERARAELHAALEPADGLPSARLGARVDQLVVVSTVETRRRHRRSGALDVGLV
jgi:hypothetical protein